MRKCFYGAAAAALAAGMFAGCKTTEENYRQAYEAAREKSARGLTAEEAAAIQREEAMPKTVYKGDSIPLKPLYVKWVAGGCDSTALRYNVVVASFRQEFNARSAYSRMRDGGYGDAVMVVDKDGRYYVGAVTTASLDSAVSALGQLRKACPVALRTPYPYILQRP